MEVLGDYTREELFITKLSSMEVIDEQQYFDYVDLDVIGLESAHLSAHLCLQQLQQDG